jgi:hypothetical protein
MIVVVVVRHLKVLIDNVKRFSEALDYIYTLPSNEVINNNNDG